MAVKAGYTEFSLQAKQFFPLPLLKYYTDPDGSSSFWGRKLTLSAYPAVLAENTSSKTSLVEELILTRKSKVI